VTYSVKEIYYTLQGEGFHTGRPAVFLRFVGCNLWTGREADRTSAICQFCDTNFVDTNGPGGGKFETPTELADAVRRTWPSTHEGSERPVVVCTGGEPLLQLDDLLIASLHDRGCEIAVETNGTIEVPAGLDWVCVSPKAGAPMAQRSGDEVKLVYPQDGLDPTSLEDLDFRWFYLQPMDGPELKRNTALAVQYCLANSKWRVRVQMQKIVGIP
jgi:7-carboxy-7-deazaguanine synthase (Cx14CxxC type)